MSRPTELRSDAWLHTDPKNSFVARHHLRAAGLGPGMLDEGKPIIGICSSWSELTPCNLHLRGLSDAVRRGILQAGGVPLEFPVFSPSEPLARPTSMLYRNLMSIDVEEGLRAHPFDAAVLLTGCDKTTPAALMGLASVDLPSIVLTGGPMLNGRFRGRAVGSGTDIWRMFEGARTGTVTDSEFTEFESCLNRSAGHCMTMGTASTMAVLTEVMGMQLPTAAALPAVDSRRQVLAEQTGARAVELALNRQRPSHVMTRKALENAAIANAAIGGSTNALLHLIAIAGRLEVPLDLDDLDRLGREVPLLVDLMPSGQFLMEEFAYAGGVPALLHELRGLLHDDVETVTGQSLLAPARPTDDDQVIRPLDAPVQPPGSASAVLRGNLAPDGAVIKPSAVSPRLLQHVGPALVFDSLDDYLAVVDDADLTVTPDTVLVVRNVGPRGYPGMPEVGNLPIPRVLLDAGIDDMVRISDGRMSGTAYGACVLHVAPEAAAGGPLALVRTGDVVELDVANRQLQLRVDEEELARRAVSWTAPKPVAERGWTRLYVDHVLQADKGADLDFLVGRSGDAPPRRAF